MKAYWTANTYTVTFNSNDGSDSDPASKPVTYDQNYGRLPSVTRKGYDFAGAEHTKGVDGNATFTFKRNVNDDEKVIIEGGALVNRTFDSFVAAGRVVRVDGNQIDENKYVASSGSLIIKLKKDYLDSLAAGKHELSVDFKDGDRVYTSTTHFIVRLKSADTPSFVVPTTGVHNDGSGLMRSLSMLALVAIGITIRMRNKVGKDYWDEFK